VLILCQILNYEKKLEFQRIMQINLMVEIPGFHAKESPANCKASNLKSLAEANWNKIQ